MLYIVDTPLYLTDRNRNSYHGYKTCQNLPAMSTEWAWLRYECLLTCAECLNEHGFDKF